ncbi:MAG: DUF1573 domain-containing protein [Saprospiraceae bacterium]
MKQISIIFILTLFFTTLSFGQDAEVPAGPMTSIEFEEKVFDWGTITQGDKVTYVFKFTNTGNESLLIKNAKGSCGCTVPQWPKAPIAPGDQGEIKVVFNSKGKMGKQSKRVTITANTDPGMTYINVTGNIIKDEKFTFTDMSKPAAKTPSPVDKKTDWKKPYTKDCFAIFPNPTSDVLKLELKEHFGETMKVMIFDSKGTQLMSNTVKDISDDIIEFDVSQYTSGTYYVNIQIGNEAVSTKCFVVAKK